MIFTTKAEYGVRLLIQLGLRSASGPVSLKAVAAAENLPLAYLERIAALLKKAELVEATRGAHGGYVLARPAEEITIDAAVLALQGAIAPMDCFIDDMTADIDTILAIFMVLLALAVIVSLFGIVNTLVLSTFERTRELGMLRAVGMTRRQVRRMIRHESIITALLGAAMGIAAGLGVAAILASVFADEGLTFAVPVGSLVAFSLVAIGAGVLAAILPARRAARMDVLTALAYE